MKKSPYSTVLKPPVAIPYGGAKVREIGRKKRPMEVNFPLWIKVRGAASRV